jgi:serine/threonine-protein kinase
MSGDARSPAPPLGDLAVGARLGEYEVTGKLGEGGMGVVYAGRQPVIEKKVAIKVLSAGCLSRPELVHRFVEEARAVNRIGHPNIVDIFSFGALPDGRQYFVMELLAGESLAARLARGPATVEELRAWTAQIGKALIAAHEAGIVHRDLKPENIWLSSRHGETSVKLLDFGIAKLLDAEAGSVTVTGMMMGTPMYMAPEQAMGREVDPRTDIYSLGVVLYEACTGVLPFQGATATAIALQHVQATPDPPSRHRPLPPALDAVILRCLAKGPENRPETVRELVREVEAALQDVAAFPPVAAPVSPTIALPASALQAGPAGTTSGGEGTRTGVTVSHHAGAAAGRSAPPATMVLSAGREDAAASTAVSPPAARPSRGRAIALAGGLALLAGGALAAALWPRPAADAPAVPAAAPAAPGAQTAPTAAAPAERGGVAVRVAGGRGRIVVDGRARVEDGAAADVEDLPAGPIEVAVEAPGMKPWSRTIDVQAGRVAQVEVTLEPAAPANQPRGGDAPAPPARAPASRRREARAGAPAAPAAAVPDPSPPPTAAPTRAQQKGLADENPLR